jgi:hypothetical protein
MSNSNDEENRGHDVGPDKSYAVGNKKPPRHTRFKPGQSGNPSGRPKGRRNFDTILLKEFHKKIPVTINGKLTKAPNDELFAHNWVKDGITKGPQSKLHLANAVRAAEARVAAAEAEARKKVDADEPILEWTEEQEKVYQELMKISGWSDKK